MVASLISWLGVKMIKSFYGFRGFSLNLIENATVNKEHPGSFAVHFHFCPKMVKSSMSYLLRMPCIIS